MSPATRWSRRPRGAGARPIPSPRTSRADTPHRRRDHRRARRPAVRCRAREGPQPPRRRRAGVRRPHGRPVRDRQGARAISPSPRSSGCSTTRRTSRAWRRSASSTSRPGAASTTTSAGRATTSTSAATTASHLGHGRPRGAPVVGGYLGGRSLAPLHELAAAATRCGDGPRSPRRCSSPWTAATPTSPRASRVAARLAGDPDPVVHNAVGIFLKHAGRCRPRRPAPLPRRARRRPGPAGAPARHREAAAGGAGALPRADAPLRSAPWQRPRSARWRSCGGSR